MIVRKGLDHVTGLLQRHPVVGLLGPRQVGKTTLALAVAESLPGKATYLDLESPADLARLREPELFLEGQTGRLVVLDEIQRQPELFPVLRGVVDRRRRAGERVGQFLVLGSASLDLLQQTSESLAGRIVYRELTPILADEWADHGALDTLWVRGGFPDSLLAPPEATSCEWREAFVRTYLERDVPQLGPRVAAETLRRFWTMLAHQQGAILNAAKLAAALGVSGQTVARYLDLLVDLLLVRRLPPFAENVGKRLVRSPKVYVRDSGLVHALLRLADRDELLGHPVAGASWEGFVVENLIAAASASTGAHFYRTSAGAEIDLLLDLGRGRRWAIEVKLSLAPKVSRGFHPACDDVGATARLVVYPGTDAFPLTPDIEAVPLPTLMARLRAA